MAKDIRPTDKPEGSGAIVELTKFIDHRDMVIKQIKGEIVQRIDGVELIKSQGNMAKLIKVGGETWKIVNIADRSEGYRLTREIKLAKPLESELQDNKAEVNI